MTIKNTEMNELYKLCSWLAPHETRLSTFYRSERNENKTWKSSDNKLLKRIPYLSKYFNVLEILYTFEFGLQRPGKHTSDWEKKF